MLQPQVEVAQIEMNDFFVKVFCEHKAGGFVRLMEARSSELVPWCSEGNEVSESMCWFAIELKSFEISIDQARGRLVGTITERGRGFVEWIKFGAKSLSQLLEGVEEFCNNADRKKDSKTWLEGGRRSGMVGGWVLLANKLRSLGIVPPTISPEVPKMVVFSQGLTNSTVRGGADSLRRTLFYRRKRLWLDKWVPEAGCVREGVEVGEVWVRLLGLPLFLWDNDFFKQFGDACGSFVAVIKTLLGCGARALFSILYGGSCSPRVSGVEPWKGGHKLKVEDDLECDSRARARVELATFSKEKGIDCLSQLEQRRGAGDVMQPRSSVSVPQRDDSESLIEETELGLSSGGEKAQQRGLV
ncbi:hypothetical protein CK203_082428 [Vitis vinifera]|uniref:Uncharacterized protein n=1 Tax=Vitis vinifera TaxID=29760 RepID=A0A438BNG5_VITVI|nr:hypothetical protein CK203_082428 [Vitis vinifera]